MNIEPIAFYHGPLTSKFGIPRQSGLATALQGRIVFEPPYRHAEAVRGLEAFDYLWLIWEFSANRTDRTACHSHDEKAGRRTDSGGSALKLTARPPRLGGNERVGVFASRSPFRPNGLGLSCVHINKVDYEALEGPVIHVAGADLMDGTPIYDLKPYVAYADAHPGARSGFVDEHRWEPLPVVVPERLRRQLSSSDVAALEEVLAQDPRPRYHHDPARVYGMPFGGCDVRFRVHDGIVEVVDILRS